MTAPAGDLGPLDHVPGSLRRRLEATSPGRREPLLAELLGAAAARFLSLPSVAVPPEASWIQLGFDSLRAVDFRGELELALGLGLRSTLLLDQPTPLALARYLLAELGLAAASAAATTGGASLAAAPGEPIAIVGAACRFPGADDLSAFADLLREGVDAIGPIPKSRFDVDALFDPDPAAEGRIYVRTAGLLHDIDLFDAAFFALSPREATLLDPQQRLLLETSWHALEHANLPPKALAGHRVGVWVGTRASEYFDSQCDRTTRDATSYYATGNAISTAAGRLAYFHGFDGPCYALDTACSGSLVAVHVAVRALRSGECDLALAGGVNAILDPVPMAGLCRARMLAPDGRCKTFDARADGYGRGEGCGLVVLRRLADARTAGDRILAVIHGSAINQDGRSGGLTVPHGPAQEAVIRQALADARVPPAAIDYVEAHGTGTSLGDPIEVAALDAVFGPGRDRPLLIGSVKTNIGHLESAAGVSGLLKTALALQAGELPPHLHFTAPNPHIDWQRTIVRVVTERTPLPRPGDRPAFAGVSSFGFSGTNCHVVLSAPPAVATADAIGSAPPWILPLQARCGAALRELARAHAERLAAPCDDAGAPDLRSWCHAAATARADLPVRAAFVAGSSSELMAALRRFADGDPDAATAHGTVGTAVPRVAFLFPGQGAQRAGMGKELAAAEPVFRRALERAAAVLAPALPAPLPELLWGSATGLLDRTDVTQPVLCAFELALLDLLRSVGVAPDHVLGHSLGDYPAAVAAGVMDEVTALQLCAARGRLMAERCPPGGMLVVPVAAERWQHLLHRHPDLAIAVHNGPANAVVGGPPDLLRGLQRDLQELGVTARLLPVSHAFHAVTTEPMLAPFRDLLDAVPLRPPALGFVDARTGTLGGAAIATREHWVRHVREPVRFAAAVQTLRAQGCEPWLEVGPTPMLTALIAEHGVPGPRVLPLQRPNRAARATFLQALAELWVRGAAVDLGAANHGRGGVPVDLPLYPFQRRRFWLQKNGATAAAPPGPHHPLLGEPSPSSLLAATDARYTNRLSATTPAWLADHQALGHVLLPAAGMFECALAAEFAARGSLPVAVRAATLRAPLVLTGKPVLVESLRTVGADSVSFRLASQDGADPAAGFRTHFECQTGVPAAPAAADLLDRAGALVRCRRAVAADAFYAHCAQLGLAYGPTFRGVQTLHAGDCELVAELGLPDGAAPDGFVVHPALLDACFQTLAAAMPQDHGLFLPLGAEEVAVLAAPQTAASIVARVRPATGAARIADLDLVDARGTLCVRVRGLQLVPAEARALSAAGSAHRELLHHVDFVPAPFPADQPPPPAGVLIAGDLLLGAALQARLPATTAHLVPASQALAALARHRIAHVVHLPAPARAGEQPMQAVERIFRDALAVAQATARAPGPPRLWFATRGAMAAGPAPAGPPPFTAVLLGLARTLGHEHEALRPTCIDLDPVVPPQDYDAHAAVLCAELRHDSEETEIAWRQGQRRVARLRRGPAPASHLTTPAGPFRLRASEYGSFDHLRAEPAARRTPGPGEIEVELLAAALNFKDVLHVAGRLREYAERAGIRSAPEQPLGFEGCGQVVAVGDGVTDLAVGQCVVVLAPDCLASHVTVPATATFVLPAGQDPVAAAGLPTVFATVLHGLVGCARLGAGETVLVHAAAGGVGLAAIQVCRQLGARVLATASPGKQAFLRGLGVEVVGDTRTAAFEAAVHAATAGRGVEVVLDTLSGEAVRKSLAVLAPGGRFVELGKLGVLTAEQVAAVRPDVQFTAFDLGDEFARDPTLRPRLLEELRLGLAAGRFAPPVATVVPLGSARAAFQQLAQGRHVGKVVLRMPPANGAPRARGDRTWVLTGAGGGLIPAVAVALADAGVHAFGLLTRGEVPAALVLDLRQRGCRVLAVRADVTDRAALALALARVRAELPPIGGIVHAAGSLADAVTDRLDWDTARRALLPKIQGALLLDELTAVDPLDAFVSFASMAGLLGNAGQAAYAAANTFLDAFAAWRAARGRPGVSIAWGPWDAAGMTARLDQRQRARLFAHGVHLLPAAVATRALFDCLEAGPLVGVLPVHWATWLAGYRDAVPPFLRELRPRGTAARGTGPQGTGPQGSAAPAVDFAAVPAADRDRTLRSLVQQHVAAVLGFTGPDQFDSERTFRELGIDSLLAVDARDRLGRALRLSLPATLLFDYPDLDRLSAHLLARLFPEAPPPAAPVAVIPEPAAAHDAELESLDTSALADALAAQVRRMEARP